jgi:hypothetical protein
MIRIIQQKELTLMSIRVVAVTATRIMMFRILTKGRHQFKLQMEVLCPEPSHSRPTQLNQKLVTTLLRLEATTNRQTVLEHSGKSLTVIMTEIELPPYPQDPTDLPEQLTPRI